MVWFKGNLRPVPFYSTSKVESWQTLLKGYENSGYDFLVLSHDQLEKIPIGESQVKFFSFTPLIDDQYDDFQIQLNAINIKNPDFLPDDEDYVSLFANNLAISNDQGRSNLVYVNADLFKSEDFYWIVKDSDVRFIELYNGYPEESKVNGNFTDIEGVWDMINADRRREDRPFAYGLVNEERLLSNGGNGHLMVRAESTQAKDLFYAFNAGNFYASTGVTLDEIRYEHRNLDGKIYPSVFVKVKQQPGVNYTIEVIQVGDGTQTSIVHDKTEAWFIVDNDTESESRTLFSRVKVTSSRVISRSGETRQFETAWTQPYVFR